MLQWYSKQDKVIIKLRLGSFHSGNLIHFWPEQRKSCWTGTRFDCNKKNSVPLNWVEQRDRESQSRQCLMGLYDPITSLQENLSMVLKVTSHFVEPWKCQIPSVNSSVIIFPVEVNLPNDFFAKFFCPPLPARGSQ